MREPRHTPPRMGHGLAVEVALEVPAESLQWWRARLEKYGVTMEPATQIIVRRDFPGIVQAPDRFPTDRADADEEKNGIAKRGENGGATQAIGVALGWVELLEPGGGPGDEEAEDVTEIVPRVGQKSERMAKETEDHFRDDEGGIEEDADGKGASETDLVFVGMIHR